MSLTTTPRALLPLAEQSESQLEKLVAPLAQIYPTIVYSARREPTTFSTKVVQDASTASYGNAHVVTSGYPKLARHMTGGQILGLQSDPDYYNYVKSSHAVGSSPWELSGLAYSTSGTLVEDTSDGQHTLTQTLTGAVPYSHLVSTTTVTKRITLTAKANIVAGDRYLKMTSREVDSSGTEFKTAHAIFDLATGTVVSSTVPTLDCEIIPWITSAFLLRLTTDFGVVGTTTVPEVEFAFVKDEDGTLSDSYVGSDSHEIKIFAVQLSDTQYGVPFAQTTAASTTRHTQDRYQVTVSTDLNSINYVATNNGTFYLEFFERSLYQATNDYQWLVSLQTALSSGVMARIGIVRVANTGYAIVSTLDGTTYSVATVESGTTPESIHRLVGRYQVGQYLSLKIDDLDEVKIAEGRLSSGTAFTSLCLGSSYPGNSSQELIKYRTSSAFIRRMFYYPYWLTDDEANALLHPLSYADTAL